LQTVLRISLSGSEPKTDQQRSIAHLSPLLAHRSFDLDYNQLLILDTAAARAATPAILEMHAIPHQASADLADVLRGAGAGGSGEGGAGGAARKRGGAGKRKGADGDAEADPDGDAEAAEEEAPPAPRRRR
jgi:hypothetical protein